MIALSSMADELMRRIREMAESSHEEISDKLAAIGKLATEIRTADTGLRIMLESILSSAHIQHAMRAAAAPKAPPPMEEPKPAPTSSRTSERK